MSGESPVRMRTVAAHSGAAFEAGQLGHRNGAAPEGTQVVNAREDPAGSRTRSRNVPNAGGSPFRQAASARKSDELGPVCVLGASVSLWGGWRRARVEAADVANVGCPGYGSGGLESLVIFDDPAARLIHGDLSVADPPSSTFSTVSFGAYCARGVFGF